MVALAWGGKALKIIGYGEMAEALRPGTSRRGGATKARTRQYAKRQRTWFARDAATRCPGPSTPRPWKPPHSVLLPVSRGRAPASTTIDVREDFDAVRLLRPAMRWYEGAPA